ncbi:MAG: hypothetical protein COV70_00955 [Parcubacteria group bacterium CG11_big_fil_rev_8_21_14_0_20_39_22]|nr:MAG: hypothetical protein COV70_00955 [Parcubacteria group bacterium CG11_big_fil_rev_8_21_14_0_20_39_22]
MTEYDHLKIEAKWQKKWEEEGLFATKENSTNKKCYVLDMFPYPSGEGLHVGHPKGYIATDVYSRMKAMQGYYILHPMGFDAFGLPAENYAIKNKVHPKTAVEKNIARYKEQLSILGFNYDWDREVDTTDPEYYKWTQWIFLQMLKKGLAYQSDEPINWCPSCKTGLANEDVEDGKCERCGTPVEKKAMRQWVLKITDYADRLISDLEGLNWPKSIIESQKNWIGRSEGATIKFPIKTGYNFVILHGFTATPEDDFYKWLKESLEDFGHKVQIPVLPDTNEPTEDGQVSVVMDNVTFDENTVIVGHILGSVVALKVIEKLDKKIAGLVTAGGFVSPNFKDKDRNFKDKFDWNFDFEKIKSNVGFIKILQDINDSAVSVEQAEELANGLGTDIDYVEATGSHFTGSEESTILDAILYNIPVFTTRADTIFSAAFVVLSPEHPLLSDKRFLSMISNREEISNYINEASKKTEIERTDEGKKKTGIEVKGLRATNPADGGELPIWVSDFVLAHYGTGAIFADAHDERDFDMAKLYNIPIKVSIRPDDGKLWEKVEKLEECFSGEGVLVNSGEFDGLKSEEARLKIVEWLKTKGLADKTLNYKLRDWVFSRQRYWGEPIPVIYCRKCWEDTNFKKQEPLRKNIDFVVIDGKEYMIVPVPENDLPVKLPNVESYEPTGTGESPLANISDWVNVPCPECGGEGKRETNTMPQWAGSSWYYLAYIMKGISNNLEFPISKYKEKIDKWQPVDLYVGGAEHATRHLIYARFWHKFLYDLGIVSTNEPFDRLQHVGLIMAEDGRKMSKRYGNVINPDDIVKRFGADTMRVYEMFMGPFDQAIAWNTDSMVGSRRFLERVWKFAGKVTANDKEAINEVDTMMNITIKKVGEDIESMKFNTAISQLMSCLNLLEKQESISQSYFETFLMLLNPFAPHITEELWHQIGHSKSITESFWPSYDPDKLLLDEVKIAVQINGKIRATFTASPSIEKQEMEEKAMSMPEVLRWIEGKKVVKTFHVPGKLVSIVVQ